MKNEKRYYNDWFIGRLSEVMEDAFLGFQDEYDIDDGGLSPEMNDKLADAYTNLVKTMNECMAWQLTNNGKEC